METNCLLISDISYVTQNVVLKWPLICNSSCSIQGLHKCRQRILMDYILPVVVYISSSDNCDSYVSSSQSSYLFSSQQFITRINLYLHTGTRLF